MPRRSAYRCAECGHEQPKWAGRCDVCGEWNTLVEEKTGRGTSDAGRGKRAAAAPAATTRIGDVDGGESPRWKTGIAEFDFALGGGIVPGSMVLIGGEPGIGKSTLLLQIA